MKYVVALFVGLFLAGCGGGSYKETKDPGPGTGTGGGGTGGGSGGVTPAQQAAWTNTVQPIVAANCALAGCHAAAGFVKSPAAFLGSKSKGMVASGRMPKGRRLSASQKAAIANL